MPDGSEFHTVEAATLKPREANVVRTANTWNRQQVNVSIFAERLVNV